MRDIRVRYKCARIFECACAREYLSVRECVCVSGRASASVPMVKRHASEHASGPHGILSRSVRIRAAVACHAGHFQSIAFHKCANFLGVFLGAALLAAVAAALTVGPRSGHSTSGAPRPSNGEC